MFPDGRVEARRVIAHAGHREALFPEELEATLEMAPRRLDEFASARAAAHDALRSLGAVGVVGAVPRGEQRQPVWPAGITGAITHTRGHCLAAVALRVAPGESSDFVIGLDAEERERVSPRVARRILVEPEKERLELVADAQERQRLVAATFGLKEAFYKAHHQLDERYLGFDVIEVELDVDGRASFASTGAELSVDPASEVSGRVTEIDGRMIAAVWIQRSVRSTSHPSRIPSAL